MKVELPENVSLALCAVAAVDATEPDELAVMVISGWLLSHRERFQAAATALGLLAGDDVYGEMTAAGVPMSGAGEGVPPSPALVPDPTASGDSDGEAAAPGPEAAGEDGISTAPAEADAGPSSPAPDVEHLCEECGRTFRTAAGLGSHRRSHSRVPPERACSNCGAVASKNEPLRQGRCKGCYQHLKEYGEERPIPDEGGRYACPDCDEDFESIRGLGAHRGRWCPGSGNGAGGAPEQTGDDDESPSLEELARQGANTHCIDCDATPMGGGLRCQGCFQTARRAAS